MIIIIMIKAGCTLSPKAGCTLRLMVLATYGTGATWCCIGRFVRDIPNTKCNTSPPQGVWGGFPLNELDPSRVQNLDSQSRGFSVCGLAAVEGGVAAMSSS